MESTQTENENMGDELEKMQRALNQSYSDRDRIGSDLDKLRDDLERSQVKSSNIKYQKSKSNENSIIYVTIDLAHVTQCFYRNDLFWALMVFSPANEHLHS